MSTIRTLAILAAATFTACGGASATPTRDVASPATEPTKQAPSLELDTERAYRLLRDADMLREAAVGYAGTMPEEVKALRYLMKHPEGDAVFKKLLDTATLPGRLYALCGLYFTDDEAFRRHLAVLRTHSGTVPFQAGCMRFERPIVELITSPQSNVLRLDHPNQTYQQWRDAHPAQTKKGWSLDIAGGGYPVHFRDAS